MINFFQDQIKTLQKNLLASKSRSNKLSWLRTFTFMLMAASIIYVIIYDNSPILVVTGILGVAFYFLVLKHRNADEQKVFEETLIKLNEEEIQRLELKLYHFDDGQEYLQDNHPYQTDLDIFGKHSIYQLINRCEIPESKTLLAEWLSAPSSANAINQRQAASNELSEDVDWSYQFSAKTRMAFSKKKKRDPDIGVNDIDLWVQSPAPRLNSHLYRATGIILGITNLIALSLWGFGVIETYLIYPSLIVSGALLTTSIKKLRAVSRGIDKAAVIVGTYLIAIDLVERSKPFQAARLQDIREQLRQEKAAQSIKQLQSLTLRLAARANMLYGLLDLPLLLDLHLMLDIVRWKKKNQASVIHWFALINEFECLLSLSRFKHAHPEFYTPSITNGAFQFETQSVGHPLIDRNEKVLNDYQINGAGSVDIITGSNMSGKSTFQRTVAVNMVIAQMGGVVNAKHLTMSPTNIFTSMRTKDDLESHTSSFYAELKRISQLLQFVKEKKSTFFVLDEILKGTNSSDRHEGAVALAKKLVKSQSFGLISTHDLELGQLAKEETTIRNFSFNSHIEGDKIVFDYKLLGGICSSFNASQLMKNMGILDQ